MERAGNARANEASLSEQPEGTGAKRRLRAPIDGAEDWNRTSDTSIFSAVLYQLSYLGTRRPRWRRILIIRGAAADRQCQ